ncbi:MAG: hypothetical protein LRY67_04630 [Gammaproteobacteria bacterium]|nr:hypothetical protein [Gammaproteobacteria bacterium]MCD8542404.1 hypothetical protein [Gammaproteobacteria bacterium]
MGGKFGKEQRKYEEEFDAKVTIPAKIYNYFSNVEVTSDPKMVFGAFIDLMLTKKTDEKKPINVTTQKKTSVFTILQCLFPHMTNYLNALQNDENLDKSNIVLSNEIMSFILSAQQAGVPERNTSQKKQKKYNKSNLSARIETSSETSDGSKRTTKSSKNKSEKLDNSLSQVLSPYRLKLITLLKKLLSDQTEFETIQRNLSIQDSTVLTTHIFQLIHSILSELVSPTSKSISEIVSEVSFILINEETTSRHQKLITDIYANQLDSCNDEPPEEPIVHLAQFYGRMFNALVTQQGFFDPFFNDSIAQPEDLDDLGYEFSNKSIQLFENIFNQCLSRECCYVIEAIRNISQSIRTESEMAACFKLLGTLIFEHRVNERSIRSILNDWPDIELVSRIREKMNTNSTNESSIPSITKEDKADFLECVSALLKEFPRQALMVKGSDINFKAIVTRQENKIICSDLSATAQRLRLEIAESKQSSSSKFDSIPEGPESQENTPIKPKKQSPLVASIGTGLNFSDEEIPQTQVTPENRSGL